MLFSNDQVVAFVNHSFEPVWESVRPVPIMKLDFGNGTVVTRTLHGNIASYVCTPKGEVLDVLPGIYTANVYLEQLQQFRLLASYVSQPNEKTTPEARLGEYHLARLAALNKNQPPPVLFNMNDLSKSVMENKIKAVLVSRPSPRTRPAPAVKDGELPLDNKKDLGDWAALVKDTEVNETIRRQQIHEQLGKQGMTSPNQLTKWVYKEVLHADLDDPYLGLGKLLFDNYAFTEEEKKGKQSLGRSNSFSDASQKRR